MKSLRFMLSVVVLMSLSVAAFAQSDAQKSFDKLKTLAGTWEGTFEGGPVHISLRVTSMGNAILHEMKGGGPENPITMLYLDGDRLVLTHYCDAGNRPRMVGTISPDGKTILSTLSTSLAALSRDTCRARSSASSTRNITPKPGTSRWRTANPWVDCWT